MCKQNNKITCNYVAMYLSHVYMCRDYLKCQKQTICVITTCVCTTHAFALLYANTLISLQCLNIKKSCIASRAVCEFYTLHNMMFNTLRNMYLGVLYSRLMQLVARWRILRPCKYTVCSHVVQVPNRRASIMCMYAIFNNELNQSSQSNVNTSVCCKIALKYWSWCSVHLS